MNVDGEQDSPSVQQDASKTCLVFCFIFCLIYQPLRDKWLASSDCDLQALHPDDASACHCSGRIAHLQMESPVLQSPPPKFIPSLSHHVSRAYRFTSRIEARSDLCPHQRAATAYFFRFEENARGIAKLIVSTSSLIKQHLTLEEPVLYPSQRSRNKASREDGPCP